MRLSSEGTPVGVAAHSTSRVTDINNRSRVTDAKLAAVAEAIFVEAETKEAVFVAAATFDGPSRVFTRDGHLRLCVQYVYVTRVCRCVGACACVQRFLCSAFADTGLFIVAPSAGAHSLVCRPHIG